jgi:hypothetical protein|eukprot:COSAG01_NODE_430_length_17153_cov_24.866717_10_plen_56_part_00
MLLDNPMTAQQIEALVSHAGRRTEAGHEMMIDYEAFLQSFSVVDVEEPTGVRTTC